MYTQVLSLLNLKCSGCSKKIKKALSELSDVFDIRFDEESRDLIYDYHLDETPQLVIEKIKHLGYPLIDGTSTEGRLAKPIVCCPASIAAHKKVTEVT